MDDELFRPTIKAEPTTESSPPWRPESIIYPAFFGGALAGAVLGLINGRRLGLKLGPLVAIGLVGVAAVIARVVATDALDARPGTRILGSAAGIIVWLVVITTQKRPFRVYLYRDKEPASLVGPGFAAAIGLGIVEALIVAAAVT